MVEYGEMIQNHTEQKEEIMKETIKEMVKKYPRLRPILEEIRKRQNMCTAVSPSVTDSLCMDASTSKADRTDAENVVIVSIDGRCGSGKSTLAEQLSEITGAGVIHMDDFFLPLELRTQDRLAQPGGNVHYERFAEEVLSKLRERKAFTYKRFDCSTMQLGEERMVPKLQSQIPLRIVEGAYSFHPVLGEYADIKVFSDIEYNEQLARILERNGEERLEAFKNRWIPMEEKYFTAFSVQELADIVV